MPPQNYSLGTGKEVVLFFLKLIPFSGKGQQDALFLSKLFVGKEVMSWKKKAGASRSAGVPVVNPNWLFSFLQDISPIALTRGQIIEAATAEYMVSEKS